MEQGKRLAGFKALVVDDNPDANEIMSVALRSEGAEVFSAEGGDEGVDLARVHQPNIILLDVMMPKGDGWTTIRTLKGDARTWDIPVIIVTAKGPGMKADFEMEGAVAYFTKPFEAGKVVDKVFQILSEKT